MGVATTPASNDLGPPNPTKKLTHWVELLGQPLSRNHVFVILRGETPPPPWSLSKVSQLIIIIGNYMRNIGYCAEQFSLLTHANVIQNFPLSRPPMETYWSKLLYHNYYLSLLTSLVDLNRLLKIRIISNVNNKARHV